MPDYDVHHCEHGCGRPAPHTWVCWDCIQHAQDQLSVIGLDEQHALLAIARREESPATHNTEGGGTGAGRADALNLGVFALWTAITHEWPRTLPTLPHQPDAAQRLKALHADVDHAWTLTHGEDEKAVTDEHVQARMDEIRPMQTHVLVPWLREHLGLNLTAERIKKWRQRGQLTPRLTPPGGRPYYHPADILHTLNQR